ncbi:hypothetical protein [Schaedlerella arabinosiphila]|uniref:hypothetical protein n=1 Tax=Schaedlerella arabinosiphila TaxID=2044587 RepID=UPI00255819E5|nr:hypothetical protein [Schaedlerella arabinosiphila]
MYCRTCGNKINDNAEICVMCGCKPLIGKSYCQNCGADTTEQQEMCTNCGARLKTIVYNNPINNGKHIIGIVLTVLGLVLLALTALRIGKGIISKEFIYDFIYEPSYFFEDISIGLVCIFISVVFIFLGMRLNGHKEKYKNIFNALKPSQIHNDSFDETKMDTNQQFNMRFNVQSANAVNNLREISISQTETTDKAITPFVQSQEEQIHPSGSVPLQQPKSVLNEQQLLNGIKTMPVQWEFSNTNTLENKELQKLCSIFLNNKEVSTYNCPEYFRQMEFVIQKKRARTPIREDYGKVMIQNILFELYEYSYLMNTFHVLENNVNDIINVDRIEFWTLVQDDCHKRIENLEFEKRNNPAIHDMFQKYELNTQKVKMIENEYVHPQEYDYIYASSMTGTLLSIILDCVLNGEIYMGNAYQPTLQVIKKYSANDIIATLDASIAAYVNFSLGMYTNGGVLPRKQ